MRPRERHTHALPSGGDARPPDAAIFENRRAAGERMVALLEHVRAERPVVLGIARGGVAVAAEVARALGAPLDVAVVRKIGAPRNPEFAIGAVAECDVHVLSWQTVRSLGLSDQQVQALIARAELELGERLTLYRRGREPVALTGRTAILIDDGLATGRSALAAVRALRRRGAARVVLAAPVCSAAAAAELQREVEDIVCATIPWNLGAVGYWYRDFSATTDEEVAALLAGTT
jgi:putative phosphoribosyl transferase